jgi:hypothetical protein
MRALSPYVARGKRNVTACPRTGRRVFAIEVERCPRAIAARLEKAGESM